LTSSILYASFRPYFWSLVSSHCDTRQRRELITCWIALDDTSRTAGTLEYVRYGCFSQHAQFIFPRRSTTTRANVLAESRGSHKWPQESKMLQNAFFTAQDYRASLDHVQGVPEASFPYCVPTLIDAADVLTWLHITDGQASGIAAT
jgi:hypothetical protein